MPVSSIVRTPMRLLAMPTRTERFERPCRLKKNLSASVSAATSLTSPPATIPLGIGSRAIWTSFAEPFTSMAAAVRDEAPILRPTVSLDISAPCHSEASRRSVGLGEAGALEQAEELIRPARARHRDLLRDDAPGDEIDKRLLEGLHAPAGVRLHDRIDLLDLRLPDEVPDRVVGKQDLECRDPAPTVHGRQERLRDDPLDRGGELDANLLLLRSREH